MQQTMLHLNKKKKNYLIDLVDDVLDENYPFNDKINTENLYTEDNLFDNNDSKDIKWVSEDVIKNINSNDAAFVDLAKDAPKK